MKTDKVKLKELQAKHNNLVKTLERIRDENKEWGGNMCGSEVTDALYYTLRSVLKDI